MKRLDQSRPFGTIYPSFQGARYEQDGLYFNSRGEAIGEIAVQTVYHKSVTAPPVYHKSVEGMTVAQAKAAPKPARVVSDAAPPLPAQVLAALHDDEAPGGPDPDVMRGIKELPPAKWRTA